jgi:thiol-disulfide isomerase/thioredoxin
MEKVKLETFTAEPPCPGCSKLLGLAEEIEKEYGEKLEVIKH